MRSEHAEVQWPRRYRRGVIYKVGYSSLEYNKRNINSHCIIRLGYIPDPPPNLSAEDQQVCDRIKARRGPAGLLRH
jgi:hypothetical protein